MDQESSSGSEELMSSVSKKAPVCKFGVACYRKNPQHFSKYLLRKDFTNSTKRNLAIHGWTQRKW